MKLHHRRRARRFLFVRCSIRIDSSRHERFIDFDRVVGKKIRENEIRESAGYTFYYGGTKPLLRDVIAKFVVQTI